MEYIKDNPIVVVIPAMALIAALCYLNRWMGKKDEFAKNVGKGIDEIREDIKRIFRLLSRDMTLESGSPLRLTDLGQAISKSLDAPDWAEKTAREISGKIPDTSAYGIQEYCFNFVKRTAVLGVDLDKKVKETAYNNGIDIGRVQDVLAIELRNELLKIHGLEPPDQAVASGGHTGA